MSEPNPDYVNAPCEQHFLVLHDVGYDDFLPGVDWTDKPYGYYCGTIVDGVVTRLEMVAG